MIKKDLYTIDENKYLIVVIGSSQKTGVSLVIEYLLDV
jgi:hypothetical protein